MDAIKLLSDDHEAVQALLKELVATTNRAHTKRSTLLQKIKRDLDVHTTIEQELFYPAFKSATNDKSDDQLYFEALEEHHVVGDLLIPDLIGTPVGSNQFAGRAKVLQELVAHHIKEEEGEMFKGAKKAMNTAELEALGAKLEERKKQLLGASK